MPSPIQPKQLIRDSYDREALRYASASAMQSHNLLRLLNIIEPYLEVDRTQLRILDAGCGLGNAIVEIGARPAFNGATYCRSRPFGGDDPFRQ